MNKNLEYEKLLKEAFFFSEEMESEKARIIWQDAIDMSPEKPEAYLYLADSELHYGWEGPEFAEKIVEEGLKHNPNYAALHLMACMVIEYLVDEYTLCDQYIEHLQKAIELEPKWPWPRVMMVAVYIDQCKLALARAEIYKVRNLLKPFMPKDSMQEYFETTFTGRANDEIGEILDLYLKEINEGIN